MASFNTDSNISKTKRQFSAFIKEIQKDKTWNLTNKVLYDLCRKYPGHINRAEVIAKTMIIGRVYAVSLERGSSENKNKGDQFYQEDVYHSFRNFFKRGDIKNRLKELKNKTELDAVCFIHSELVADIWELRELDKVSFASKYLHFHFPKAFYILDSRVKKALPKLESYLNLKRRSNTQNKSIYSKYAKRLETVRNQIKIQTGLTVSIRELDSLLIRLANSMTK